MKLVVHGLQRMGTTIMYELIARSNRDRYLYLYEPLTPLVYQDNFNIEHDFLGPVTHDYLRYRHLFESEIKRLVEIAYYNSGDRDTYLSIIENVLARIVEAVGDGLVVKDLYLWLLGRKLAHVEIYMFRDVQDWARAMRCFLHDQLTPTRKKILDKVRKLKLRALLRLHRVGNVLQYARQREEFRTSWLGGLRPYVLVHHPEMVEQLREAFRKCDWRLLEEVLHAVHASYLSHIHNMARKHDNVLIVHLADLQYETEKVVNEVNYYLKDINLKIDLDLARKLVRPC